MSKPQSLKEICDVVAEFVGEINGHDNVGTPTAEVKDLLVSFVTLARAKPSMLADYCNETVKEVDAIVSKYLIKVAGGEGGSEAERLVERAEKLI